MFSVSTDRDIQTRGLKRKTTLNGLNIRTNFSVEISYGTLHTMYEKIGKYDPERGGFLFGSFSLQEDKVVLNHFLYDGTGRTSHSSYYPSERSNSIIQEYEASEMQSFVGVVHSHPAGMDYPSGPDIVAMDSLLERNSHLKFVVAPIINSVEITDSRYERLLSLNGSKIKISFYIRNRHHELFCPGKVDVFEYNDVSPSIVVRDVKYVLNSLGIDSLSDCSTLVTRLRGKNVIITTVNIQNKKVVFIFSPSYPINCPTVIIYRNGNASEITTYEWSANGQSDEMLLSIISNNL